MDGLYFFRDVRNYDELCFKTKKAYARKSVNRRKFEIVKYLDIEPYLFLDISLNMTRNNPIFYEYKDIMRIKNGTWECISLNCSKNEIIVMSDGYQYAKFSAIRYLEDVYK